MKNIWNFIYNIFVSQIDSIKNDSLLDMLIMWLVFISVFVLFPIFVIIFGYAFICTLPYICLCVIICLITFTIPLSLRIIFNVLKKIKK